MADSARFVTENSEFVESISFLSDSSEHFRANSPEMVERYGKRAGARQEDAAKASCETT